MNYPPKSPPLRRVGKRTHGNPLASVSMKMLNPRRWNVYKPWHSPAIFSLVPGFDLSTNYTVVRDLLGQQYFY